MALSGETIVLIQIRAAITCDQGSGLLCGPPKLIPTETCMS